MTETNNKNDSEDSLETTKSILITLGGAGLAITLSVYIVYVVFFHDQVFIAKTDLWGQFGDFIGGVLNPLVGLLALIGLLWTIYQNQRELALSRKSLTKSAEALEQNNVIAQLEAENRASSDRKDDIFRMIDMLHKENILNLSVTVEGDNLKIRNIVSEFIARNQYLAGIDILGPKKVNLEKLLTSINEKNVGDAKDILRNYTDILAALNRDLKQLKIYLSLYEKETQDNIVTSYYKLRFVQVVRGLKALGKWIEDKTLEYYEEEYKPKDIR